MSRETRAEIFDDFELERQRQIAKWGLDQQTHPDGTDPSFAAAAKRAQQWCDATDNITWRDILDEEVYEAYAETNLTLLREELIQAGAVITAWLEDIDRRL